MDNKEFKVLFGIIAKENSFERAFGGWFKESPECIAVLDLQKSNYGNYYQLMFKVYVQGMFGNVYIKSKTLLKNTGSVFRGEPPEYKDVFDLDVPIDDEKRKQKLESLFTGFIVPFTDEALTREGIKGLAQKEAVYLLPAVKEQLELLST